MIKCILKSKNALFNSRGNRHRAIIRGFTVRELLKVEGEIQAETEGDSG